MNVFTLRRPLREYAFYGEQEELRLDVEGSPLGLGGERHCRLRFLPRPLYLADHPSVPGIPPHGYELHTDWHDGGCGGNPHTGDS